MKSLGQFQEHPNVRTQAQSKAERKALEDEEVVPEINEELEARQKAADEKNAEKQKAIEDRKALQQKKRDSLTAAAEARRQKILDDRAKAKAEREGTTVENDSTNIQAASGENKTPAQIEEEKRQQKLQDREARKKELEERRQKILADREKAKKEREEQKKKTDSINNNN